VFLLKLEFRAVKTIIPSTEFLIAQLLSYRCEMGKGDYPRRLRSERPTKVHCIRYKNELIMKESIELEFDMLIYREVIEREFLH